MSVWDELRYFGRDEFNHPDQMDPAFLRSLDSARHLAGVPFHITDDVRIDDDPDDDEDSAHNYGMAVDIRAHDARTRHHILRSLYATGFRRVGVYDKHIHVDAAGDHMGFDQDVTWMGKSR